MKKLILAFISIFFLGLLIGYIPTLASPSPGAPNPGHTASEIGGTSDAERTFNSTGKYTFLGNLDVRGGLTVSGTVSASAFKTRNQACPSGWTCEVNTWDIAAQSIRAYGDLFVNGNVGIGTTNPTGQLTVKGSGSTNTFLDIIANPTDTGTDSWAGQLRFFNSAGTLLHIIRGGSPNAPLTITPGYNGNAPNKLKVTGDTEITGNLSIGGDITGFNIIQTISKSGTLSVQGSNWQYVDVPIPGTYKGKLAIAEIVVTLSGGDCVQYASIDSYPGYWSGSNWEYLQVGMDTQRSQWCYSCGALKCNLAEVHSFIFPVMSDIPGPSGNANFIRLWIDNYDSAAQDYNYFINVYIIG